MITATTGSGTTTYTYDYENRLTNVEVHGTMVATYTYDALGRRIGIDDSGTQTWTVFNGKSADANPYADFTSSGTLKMRYLDGLAVDELLARTDASGDTSWYFTDQVGSVIAIASITAGVQDEITYDPFGNIVTQTDSAEADRFMFAGMEYDSSTGLYYDHARYYDAAIGRFVSQDPKGFAAGDTNLYRYVGNEPTVVDDPTGNAGVAVGLVIAASVLGPGWPPNKGPVGQPSPPIPDPIPFPPDPPQPAGPSGPSKPGPITVVAGPIAGPENNPTEGIIIGPGEEVPPIPVFPPITDPGEPNKIGIYIGIKGEVQWFQQTVKLIRRIFH